MKKFLPFIFVMLSIMAVCTPLTTFAQEITVSGRVVDADGSGIPGVTVLIKGTSRGTVTNVNGEYSIVAEQGQTLIFQSIGFVSQEAAISGSTVNVTLTASVKVLDEVVVSGLASQVKRANLANAIETIDAQTISGITVPQTVDGALYGKFKGVNIIQNSGAPGGGIAVRLRGITSLLGSSQPLYIVDGVYVNNSSISANTNFVSAAAAGGNASNQDNPSNRIADLSPEDIESIEVLKGASAASIYGSRSAAGVIIIRTKRGNPGRTTVKFNQSIGFNTIINKLGTRSWTEDRVRASFGEAQVPNFVAARDAGRLFDYEEELYGEVGLLLNSQITVSGGNDRTRFYVSAINKDEEGIVDRTNYEKTSLRVNLTHKITDNLEIVATANYINSVANRGFFNNDNSGTTLGVSFVGTPAWADLFPDANGNYPNNPFAGSNFLETRDVITNRETNNRLIASITFNWTLLKNEKNTLLLTGTGGLDSYSLETDAIFPSTLQFQSNGNGTNGASIQGTTNLRNINYQAFLVHTFVPNDVWSFTSQAGILYLDFERDTKINVATQLIGTQSNLDQAGSVAVSQTRVPEEDFGFFIQEEINFDDKIILTGGLRADKSSNNGDVNKLFFYPKASAAFNVHNFGFWSFSPTVSQFKVRVAYGQAGNFAPFGNKFTSLNGVLINASAGSLIGTSRGDENIEPERQEEIETGFDIGFLENRLSANFTYYRKNVTDLLLTVQVPTSSGFATQLINGADLVNQGIEVGIDALIINNTNFSWNATLNTWLNRGRVTRLDVPAFNTGAFGATLGTLRIEEGKSPTQYVGIDPNPEDAATGLSVFGNAEPDFQMSLINNLTYKNFELYFIWHWKQGYENVNLSTLLSDLSGTSPDYDDTGLDPSGQESNGDFRVNQLGVSAAPFVEDASYLRLRELGFYYNIREESLQNFFGGFIKGIKVGFSGFNLVNIFDYNSYDPEVSNFGSDGLSTGIEVTPFPSSKRYYFHLNFTF